MHLFESALVSINMLAESVRAGEMFNSMVALVASFKFSCCSLAQVLAVRRVELITCFCLHCPSPLDFMVAAHKRALEG